MFIGSGFRRSGGPGMTVLSVAFRPTHYPAVANDARRDAIRYCSAELSAKTATRSARGGGGTVMDSIEQQPTARPRHETGPLLAALPERLHHNAYVVEDQEANRRFLEDVLGIPLVATWCEKSWRAELGREVGIANVFRPGRRRRAGVLPVRRP